MTFELIFDKQARKDFSKLPERIAKSIFRKCRETKSNPMRHWKKNIDRGDYKLRVGDYRAIADIDFELKRIAVTKVGLRHNIYQKSK